MIGESDVADATDFEFLRIKLVLKGLERERVASENHYRANQVVLARTEANPIGTGFECIIEAPSQLPWPQVVVRAYARSEHEAALGILRLRVDQ